MRLAYFVSSGIISEIPTSLCEKMRKPEGAQGKNVILVVGDGMGWGELNSMIRM
jgi:alkaline phosphatase